jgi:hypothetical protein
VAAGYRGGSIFVECRHGVWALSLRGEHDLSTQPNLSEELGRVSAVGGRAARALRGGDGLVRARAYLRLNDIRTIRPGCASSIDTASDASCTSSMPTLGAMLAVDPRPASRTVTSSVSGVISAAT